MHPDTGFLKARGGSAAEPRQRPPVCSCVGLGRVPPRTKRLGDCAASLGMARNTVYQSPCTLVAPTTDELPEHQDRLELAVPCAFGVRQCI